MHLGVAADDDHVGADLRLAVAAHALVALSTAQVDRRARVAQELVERLRVRQVGGVGRPHTQNVCLGHLIPF